MDERYDRMDDTTAGFVAYLAAHPDECPDYTPF